MTEFRLPISSGSAVRTASRVWDTEEVEKMTGFRFLVYDLVLIGLGLFQCGLLVGLGVLRMYFNGVLHLKAIFSTIVRPKQRWA